MVTGFFLDMCNVNISTEFAKYYVNIQILVIVKKVLKKGTICHSMKLLYIFSILIKQYLPPELIIDSSE